MNPRLIAWRVLMALESTPRHLENLLQEELARQSKAPERDRAQAVNLVYSVLRHRLRLDHRLAPLLKRPIKKLDRPVLTWLRLGAAELILLGTPAHAALHATVQAAKATPAARAQGLINGVLRSLVRAGIEEEPPLPADPAEALAVAYSHPPWLVRRLVKAWGEAKTEAWLAAAQEPAPPVIRANTLKITRDDLTRKLAPACEKIMPHELSPDALVLHGVSGPLNKLPGYDQGLWQAQDPGSQLMARLLAPLPGQRVLDLCAGAGGKTSYLAALMENQGELWAVDNSPGRLAALKQNLARLGVKIARIKQADARRLDGEMGLFDRILVDAPCSGLGTLGRRPDIRWRVGPKDPAKLAGLQSALLARAVELLRPDGALLYCTCTVTAEENQEVVGRLLAAQPGLRPDWTSAAADLPSEQGFVELRANHHHCESFFAARLVKVG